MLEYFVPETLLYLEPGDEGWDDDLRNKAVWIPNINKEGGLIDPDLPRFSLTLYSDYPEAGMIQPVRGAYPTCLGYEPGIFDVEQFIIVFDDQTHCKNLVVSADHSDPAIELYDHPFTLLPTEHSCSHPGRDGSTTNLQKCPFAAEGNYEQCGYYSAQEPMEIGVIDGNPVMLERKHLGNTYTYLDQTFTSYKAFNKWAEDNNKGFHFTFHKNVETTPFVSSILNRLAKTYA